MTLAFTPAWINLETLAHRDLDIRDQFADNPDRVQALTVALDDGFFVDFSKQSVDGAALAALRDLARQQEVERWRDVMFSGAIANVTERRRVLHPALRADAGDVYDVDGASVVPEVLAVRSIPAGASSAKAGRSAGSSRRVTGGSIRARCARRCDPTPCWSR